MSEVKDDRAFLLGMATIHNHQLCIYINHILETKGLTGEFKYRAKNALAAIAQLDKLFLNVLDPEEQYEISVAFSDLARFMLDNPDKRDQVIEIIKQL